MGLLLCIHYFDEKFNNDKNIFQKNTGNYNFLKKSAKAGDRYLFKEVDWGVEGKVSLGGLEEMGHICQLTNFI